MPPNTKKCVLPCHYKQGDGHEHHCHFVLSAPAPVVGEWQEKLEAFQLRANQDKDSGYCGGCSYYQVKLKDFISELLTSHREDYRKWTLDECQKNIEKLEAQVRGENNGVLVARNDPHNSLLAGKLMAYRDLLTFITNLK